METYSFFAMLSRMKYINRWGLMRNARQENLSEHSLEVAYIAHVLSLLSGTDPTRAVFCALYHDCSEIITGDLPTPIKYHDPQIKDSYKQLEQTAASQLLGLLPESLAAQYHPCFFEQDEQVLQLVKAADKLSALIKCIEEIRMGNHDFESARQAQLDALAKMQLPAVEQFLQQFLPAYELTLDEMNRQTHIPTDSDS
ncbi:MAG: 5'-deoxynucleotidase [Anaerotruncus sp.]|nr:5'-deoxynucleotidase [Anaerotruncus sp.]